MRILGTVASSSREVPNAPTIGTATDVGTSRAYNNGAATVTFTAPTFDGGLPITGYTVTSSPGGFTGTGASSPVTVTGLQSSTSYTFTVTATNSRGTGAASSASNSITATTVPQAPTIGTATATGPTTATVTYTAGATGGKAVSAYTATSSPGSLTGTGASPITVSGLTSGTAYTFTVTATNANGTSTASAASNSITPTNPALGAWSSSTQYPLTTIDNGIGNGNGSVIYVGSGLVNGSDPVSNGYTWVSGWTSLSLPSARYQPATQRLTTSGSSNSLMILAGYGAGFASSNLATILNGSSFSAGTVYPITGPGIGFASLNGSGNLRASGNSLTGYYQTSFGGSWTNTGVNQPVSAGRSITMVDNNFGGEGWLFTDGTGSTNLATYKCTSTTSAWTAMTSLPWSSASSPQPAVAATVISNTVMLFKNDGAVLNPYTFNGTTYTSQTAISSSISSGWNTIGAIGNVLHNIRTASTSSTTQNYHQVATFA